MFGSLLGHLKKADEENTKAMESVTVPPHALNRIFTTPDSMCCVWYLAV